MYCLNSMFRKEMLLLNKFCNVYGQKHLTSLNQQKLLFRGQKSHKSYTTIKLLARSGKRKQKIIDYFFLFMLCPLMMSIKSFDFQTLSAAAV